jgi:hypothetical protein
MLEWVNRHMLRHDSILLLLPIDAGLRGLVGISQAYQAIVGCISSRFVEGQKLRPHLFRNKMHAGQPFLILCPQLGKDSRSVEE